MGGPVSLLTKDKSVNDTSGISGQAIYVVRQAVPAAKNARVIAAQQAVPLARSAGSSIKQGTNGAVAWVTPYVGAARHWAAPWLEQSATAVTDNLAPKVSDALITAAHKIDYVEPKQHRRLTKATVLAGSMLLTAAGAAAAFSLRRRDGNGGYTAAPMADTGESATSPTSMGDGDGPDETAMPDAEANGHPPIS
jgi:hypothetical protein